MPIALRFGIVAAAVVAALALAGGSRAHASPAHVHDTAIVLTASEEQAVAAFEVRLEEYMRLHRKRLVLMDAEARIVIDFTDDVLP